MPAPRQPEILPPGEKNLAPRFKRGSGIFADENLDMLAHVLDDWFQIPGTSIRFGLDGIIGLIPGLGDILGGLASTIIGARTMEQLEDNLGAAGWKLTAEQEHKLTKVSDIPVPYPY